MRRPPDSFRRMRLLLLLLFPLTVCGGETPSPPALLHTRIDYNNEFCITFESSVERRYIVQVSPELGKWEDHYLSPFKDNGDGLKVRQLGEYGPSSEFYRVGVLPWRFQSLDTSLDWIGNVSMSRLPDGQPAFVYQNRDRNELYYGEVQVGGGPPLISRVAGTDVEDEPGFWDNSGYTDVTLQIDAAGAPYIVCMDDHAEEMILLRRRADAAGWQRTVILSGLSTPYWAFPKFAISPQGRMGIVYRGDDGSYFALSSIGNPLVWSHRKISNESAHSAHETGIVFNDADDAIVQAYGSFFIDCSSGVISPIQLSGQIQCRRGVDGSLITMGRSFDATNIRRSVDGGLTWMSSYAARLSNDDAAVSIDCDSEGRLSLFRPPALYRQNTPGGAWQRTVMRGGAIHQADPSGKIRLVISEYDGEICLVSED